MKSIKFVVISLFCALIVLVSCVENESDFNDMIIEGYANVDERLWDLFQKFEEEAAARSIAVDLNGFNITGVIESIPESGVAGTCSYGANHPSDIVIDLEYWNLATALQREEVVFHELGHCYLMRGHTEGTVQGNICASIMRSGLGGCRSVYNDLNREYYLDELFGLE